MKEDKKIEISFNVGENNMKNKNYDFPTIAIASVGGEWVPDKKQKRIKKEELSRNLKELLKMTRYKIDIVIKTLLDLKVISEDDKYYYIENVNIPYIRLSVDVIKYCINNLSSLPFKVYCYLRFIQSKHESKGYLQNYFFSEKELLKVCGYSVCGKNYVIIKEALITLEDLGLIRYNHQGIYRPNCQGTYKELYAVYDTCHAIQEARRETVKEIKMGELFVEDSPANEMSFLDMRKELNYLKDQGVTCLFNTSYNEVVPIGELLNALTKDNYKGVYIDGTRKQTRNKDIYKKYNLC